MSPLQRHPSASRYVGGAFVVLLHVVIVAALLQIASVRSRAAEAAPVFVKLITPAPLPPPEPRQPVVQKVVPKSVPRLLVPEAAVVSRTELVVTERIPEPPVATPIVEAKVEAITPPTPAAPAPKVISKVEYIRAPQLEYPALSRRVREQGRVLLRVLIGRDGRAEVVEVQTSSGSPRLDEAAIKAAREALYRPYSENGVAIPVWALVPTLFELS